MAAHYSAYKATHAQATSHANLQSNAQADGHWQSDSQPDGYGGAHVRARNKYPDHGPADGNCAADEYS